MQKHHRPALVLVPLAALLCILPLVFYGCSCGHDLSFHLLNWQETASQWTHGTLHPRWAFTPAFGAGEPRFVFYPPLSWTIGGLLTLFASALAHLTPLRPEQTFALTPILYTGIALTAAGFAMLHLARRFVSPAAATLAAVVYLANPYTLFTAYERTAFAELLAAALLPLLLAALLPDPESTLPSIPAIAIPLALLWLTNAPAAVIGSYAVAFILLLRIVALLRSPAARPQASRLLLKTTAASLLAFALAAFYLVPALLERRWVQISMAILPGLRPDDNTLFHHTSDALHDAVLHTASLLAVTLLAVTAAALTLAARRTRSAAKASSSTSAPTQNLTTLAILTAAIATLLTPLSLPLWHHLPQLAFLQFPWRLLSLLAPVSALALALTLRSLHLNALRLAILSLALPAALGPFAFHNFTQACDPDDTPQARFTHFHSLTGDDPTDEYTPTTADNDSLKPNNPPFRLLPGDVDDDTPPPGTARPGPAPLSLTLTLPRPGLLILNLRDYPTWRVTVNGTLDSDRDHRADGLLTLPLPAGRERIVLSQHTPSAELFGDGLSLAALALTVALLRKHPPRSRT